MKIKIIQIGKSKERYIQEGVAEFLKRLKPFVNLEVIEIRENPPSKTKNVQDCLKMEAEQIAKYLKKDDFTVVLDETGGQMNSVGFAELIKKNKDSGRTLTFIIGGPYGLSEEIKKVGNMSLSLSKMTFTHQMIRLFLFEQIYRGFCIIAGKQYHY